MSLNDTHRRGTKRRRHPNDNDEMSMSDADSEAEALMRDMTRRDAEILALRDASPRASSHLPPRRRGPRGPRKAAEPRGDIKARLFEANQAWLNGDVALALEKATEVTRINAEIRPAWLMLAPIKRELGETDAALLCMVTAAHLMPKDSVGWLDCGDFAVGIGNLETARYCYSSAIRADRNCTRALLARAEICCELGKLAPAIADYRRVLEQLPGRMAIVRKLAQACLDYGEDGEAIRDAISLYRSCFERPGLVKKLEEPVTWSDAGIFAQLFAALGQYRDAIQQLKSLARGVVGRAKETFWDAFAEDDREWDLDNDRRLKTSEFSPANAKPELFGAALPLPLRARLALYRLNTGDEDEAMKHLSWLDPTKAGVLEAAYGIQSLLQDIADRLLGLGWTSQAQAYYELLSKLPPGPSAETLLQLGRCHLAQMDHVRAEERFLSVIEIEPSSIEARIELAKLYELAKEEEEALVLASEAIALHDAIVAQDPQQGEERRPFWPSQLTGRAAYENHSLKHQPRRKRAPPEDPEQPGLVVKRRYRPRRLVGQTERQEEERHRAEQISRKYTTLQDLRSRMMAEGGQEATRAWMMTAKELVDDFRAARRFYNWNTFLRTLGHRESRGFEKQASGDTELQLTAMVERLSKSLAPSAEFGEQIANEVALDTYQGISFGEWLELFLDYAISLAMDQRSDDAYEICAAARDSTVFSSSKTSAFRIYLAWGVCAVYVGDEETCVAVARHFMKDAVPCSDAARMFAALCRLSNAPVSWYSSAPSQKYLLRKIKAMDVSSRRMEGRSGGNNLDISLLMLYGHILFTTGSYNHALSYFLRARAYDPENPMINLSTGLGYIHQALKRQSSNRQYHIIQGLGLIFRYYQARAGGDNESWRREAAYDVGRTFQLLGLHNLALRYYWQVQAAGNQDEVSIDTSYNVFIISLTSGDNRLARMSVAGLPTL